jgi:hypothetical protein
LKYALSPQVISEPPHPRLRGNEEIETENIQD